MFSRRTRRYRQASTCSITAWSTNTLRSYCEAAQIPFEKMLALGRTRMSDPSERFSMAVFALKTSAFRNAVSMLHRYVSQEMFQDLWPRLPVDEVPITSVTNGVHSPTWINGDLASLYDQYLQPDWRERLEDIKNVGTGKRNSRPRTVGDASQAQTAHGVLTCASGQSFAASAQRFGHRRFDACRKCSIPDVFTIGFARRFRHVQARYAAVQRCRPIEAASEQSEDAGADCHCGQSASQR